MIYHQNLWYSTLRLTGVAVFCALSACAPTSTVDHHATAVRDQSVATIPVRNLGTTGAEPGVHIMEGEAVRDWQTRGGAVRER